MYAPSDFLIMVFVKVRSSHLEHFHFRRYSHEKRENHPSV